MGFCHVYKVESIFICLQRPISAIWPSTLWLPVVSKLPAPMFMVMRSGGPPRATAGAPGPAVPDDAAADDMAAIKTPRGERQSGYRCVY